LYGVLAAAVIALPKNSTSARNILRKPEEEQPREQSLFFLHPAAFPCSGGSRELTAALTTRATVVTRRFYVSPARPEAT